MSDTEEKKNGGSTPKGVGSASGDTEDQKLGVDAQEFVAPTKNSETAADEGPDPDQGKDDGARDVVVRAGAAVTRMKSRALPMLLGEDPSSPDNPYASYLSRSVLLEEAAPPKNARAAIIIVLGALLIFVLWASLSQLDEKAVASGEILPVNFVQPVQHFEGGIVADVRIEDGQVVAEGEALIVLDSTAPLAELETLRARNASLGLQMERLRAFATGEEPDLGAIAPGYADMIADQTRLHRSQINSRNAQTSVITSQVDELIAAQKGLAAQEDALQKEVGFAGEEVGLRSELVEKGLTSRVVFLNAQRQLARAEGQLAEIITQAASNRAAVAEARLRKLEVEERLKTEALNEQGKLAGEREQVGEQLARLEDRVARTTITAPVAGIVKGLVVTSPGGVIGPGQILLEIVPDDRELIAEVRISPKDVGHVKAGSPAVIKIDTFSYSRYGGIEGRVKQVSASTFQDEDGNPYFRGLVTLDQDYVGIDPLSNRLAPGMTLVADIKTGKKSLMEYLLRPISRALEDSFSER